VTISEPIGGQSVPIATLLGATFHTDLHVPAGQVAEHLPLRRDAAEHLALGGLGELELGHGAARGLLERGQVLPLPV
jgi:hypothetical protein